MINDRSLSGLPRRQKFTLSLASMNAGRPHSGSKVWKAMAIQSAEAQTSTLAKLAPPHTTAHKLPHQPAALLLVSVAWMLTTYFLRSSSYLNTDRSS